MIIHTAVQHTCFFCGNTINEFAHIAWYGYSGEQIHLHQHCVPRLIRGMRKNLISLQREQEEAAKIVPPF